MNDPTTPSVSGLELRLRDTAQMRTQFPDWLLKEMEAAADHIADLQSQLTAALARAEASEAAYIGVLPAPITNSDAWPARYADGWNDCAQIALDGIKSVRLVAVGGREE